MTDNQDLVKCPLCEGHGAVRRAELTERLNNSDLKLKIDSCGDEIVPREEDTGLGTTSVGSRSARDFQKDVHSWNPQLPMWRRSPKE